VRRDLDAEPRPGRRHRPDQPGLIIEDDGSDRQQLAAVLPAVALRCDLLLGPYSTMLMRMAGRMAAESDWLI